MGKNNMLLYEATVDDLVAEIRGRFPKGTILGIVHHDETFQVSIGGKAGAVRHMAETSLRRLSQRGCDGDNH